MIAYLDIETAYSGEITVVGIYIPETGVHQIVNPWITDLSIDRALEGVTVIKTFNGSRFDLPVIKRRTGLDLTERFEHQDLIYDCRKNGLKGGLKKAEELLGIHRETAGINGSDALCLWHDYGTYSNQDSLDLLLHYNREDIVNLELLEQKLNQMNFSAHSR